MGGVPYLHEEIIMALASDYQRKIEQLIEASPHKERIQSLLHKPLIGSELYSTDPADAILMKYGNPDSIPNQSNCFGTLVHLLGKQEEALKVAETLTTNEGSLKDEFKYHIHPNTGYLISLPVLRSTGEENGFDRPGYVDGIVMEEMLRRNKEYHRTIGEEPDTEIALFYGAYEDNPLNRQLIHSALYLGKIEGGGMLVQQPNNGEPFRVATIDETKQRLIFPVAQMKQPLTGRRLMVYAEFYSRK